MKGSEFTFPASISYRKKGGMRYSSFMFNIVDKKIHKKKTVVNNYFKGGQIDNILNKKIF